MYNILCGSDAVFVSLFWRTSGAIYGASRMILCSTEMTACRSRVTDLVVHALINAVGNAAGGCQVAYECRMPGMLT